MKTRQRKKSEKTQGRIKEVKSELASYCDSLQRMIAFAEGKATLEGKGYTQRAEAYQQTIEDKLRLPAALQNIEQQIAILEKELDTLKIYGG